jgi:baseplate J-like protein
VLPLRWRYLSGHEWKKLPPALLLSDSTMGLTRSGIVKISLPGDVTTKSSLMPGGLCWIEAAAPKVSGVYWSRVVSIATQAVSATRVCDLQSELVPAVTPAGSITQLTQKQPQIKAVRQPFSSSDGRSRESPSEFRARVSERLRHKDRAIQGWDYERLVLDRFPEVGQVKCIGHNNSRNFPGTIPVDPGRLYLVVTPRLEDTTVLEPRLPQYVLREIEVYVGRHVSDCVRDIHAINPVYETLKVFATVEFSVEGDGAGYIDDLDAALAVLLQPWRNPPVKPMPIGSGQVQCYEVAKFIQQQPYVKKVHPLFMLHTYQTEEGYVSRWLSQEQRAGASAPWSVLIPAPHHSIAPSERGHKDSIDEGIPNLTVGSDLVVSPAEKPKEDAPELRYFLVVPAHPEHENLRR